MFTQCVVRGFLEKWPRRQEFWDWHYWHRILRGFNDQKINGRIPSNVVGLIQQKSFVNSTSLVITELHCKNIVVTLCFHDWLIWGKIFRKPWKHHGKYGTYRETMVCTIYIYVPVNVLWNQFCLAFPLWVKVVVSCCMISEILMSCWFSQV